MEKLELVTSAHIIGGVALGGAELFYTRLVTALHQRGHPTLAITVPHSRIAHELPLHLPQRQIPMRNVWDYWARWKINRAIAAQQPALVQTYMGRATRMTHLAAGKRPIHIARLGGYYQPRGYRHAHAWITVSGGIADHLIQHGFPKQRVFHISNFLTPTPPSSAASLQQLRAQLQLPAEALLVTAVGRLHPIKGFTHLLAAFAALPRHIAQRPVYLLMVGDGALAADLQQQAQQLGITQRVRWLGWRNDAQRFQELADVCVCSSLQEGIGNVILEAWAQRRAVLATRTLGPMEIAHHAQDAWLVPVGDASALAQGMQLLLSDAQLRDELAANGYNTLLTRHSEDAIVSAYLDVYRRLLQ